MANNIFSCKGKIAVVTGGRGLLGREIVKGLLSYGARVYVADISTTALSGLNSDKRVNYISLDIASEASIDEAFSHIIRKEDKINILVNAAYPRTSDWASKFEDFDFSCWKNNLNSHLGGYFLSSQKAARQMKKQKTGGSIINLASIYGICAPDFSIYQDTDMTMPVAYAAIKSGIISLTRYIAAYYAKDNIRANTISPGGIFDKQDKRFVEKYADRVPLGRMGEAGEIVGAVIYLASEASSYVTGHNLIVDGGWSI